MSDSTATPNRLSPVIGFTAVVAIAVTLYLAAVLLRAYYDRTVADEQLRKTLDGRLVQRQTLEAKHREQLSTYHWADPKDRTRVVVPLDRAMQLVADELAAASPGQPASLVPAVTPAHDQPTAPAVWGWPTGAAPTRGASP